jgi:hypothetical protein
LNSSSDLQLIDATLSGDTRAFDALLRRYQDRLVHSLEHALGSREDAMDVAQQAFIHGCTGSHATLRTAEFDALRSVPGRSITSRKLLALNLPTHIQEHLRNLRCCKRSKFK